MECADDLPLFNMGTPGVKPLHTWPSQAPVSRCHSLDRDQCSAHTPSLCPTSACVNAPLAGSHSVTCPKRKHACVVHTNMIWFERPSLLCTQTKNR